MNKVAAKQVRQTKVSLTGKREKKLSKKVCKCSGKKNLQSKVPLRNQPKIKKVINNIRSMCGDSTVQNSGKELAGKTSDQSVVYIGTYPRQSYPLIDLTASNSSLETNNDDDSFSHNSFSPKSYKFNLPKTLYLPHFKTTKISLLPRLTKSATLATTQLTKNKLATSPNCLATTDGSCLLNESRSKLLQKMSVLDIPLKYTALDDSKDFNSCPSLDEGDHEAMNMILDMEDDYQFLYNGTFETEPILDCSSRDLPINKLIEKYYYIRSPEHL